MKINLLKVSFREYKLKRGSLLLPLALVTPINATRVK